MQEVAFSCQDMSNLMQSVTSASARADVFKQAGAAQQRRRFKHQAKSQICILTLLQVIMSSLSDRKNVTLLEHRLNPRQVFLQRWHQSCDVNYRDLETIIKQLGIL